MTEDRVLTILVAEDELVDRQLLQRTLAGSSLKFSIHEVGTVKEAIKEIKENKFDIALLDYRLPDGTALTILKELTDTNVSSTPIVVLTVHAEKKVALEALEHGAQDFLPKELINVDYLERSIRYSIQRHKLFLELQWSKERERIERELRALQEASKGSAAQATALRDSSNTFNQLVDEYESGLRKAIVEVIFKTPQEVPQRMRVLAEKLSALHAGPKDVVDVHTTALKRVISSESASREEYFSAEGRILLVQVMGYLCGFYRDALITSSNTDASLKRKMR